MSDKKRIIRIVKHGHGYYCWNENYSGRYLRKGVYPIPHWRDPTGREVGITCSWTNSFEDVTFFPSHREAAEALNAIYGADGWEDPSAFAHLIGLIEECEA